jgi:hypothetical protein
MEIAAIVRFSVDPTIAAISMECEWQRRPVLPSTGDPRKQRQASNPDQQSQATNGHQGTAGALKQDEKQTRDSDRQRPAWGRLQFCREDTISCWSIATPV